MPNTIYLLKIGERNGDFENTAYYLVRCDESKHDVDMLGRILARQNRSAAFSSRDADSDEWWIDGAVNFYEGSRFADHEIALSVEYLLDLEIKDAEEILAMERQAMRDAVEDGDLLPETTIESLYVR